MSSAEAQTASSSARLSVRIRLILGAALVTILATSGGVLIGHATADSNTEGCAAIRTAEEKQGREAARIANDGEDNQEDYVLSLRTQRYIVLQNPNCFTAKDRAEAKAILDKWDFFEG